MAEENFGVDSGLKSMSDVYLGVTLQARGDTAGAQMHIGRSLEGVESGDVGVMPTPKLMKPLPAWRFIPADWPQRSSCWKEP